MRSYSTCVGLDRLKPSEPGYKVHQAVFNGDEIERLRAQADQVGTAAGNPCVRHLRDRSRIFAALATDPRLLKLLPDGYAPVRSILFDKTPDRNWPVAWHQDLTIAVEAAVEIPGYGPWSTKDGVPHVQPPVEVLQSMVTIRIHLDDATAANGALCVCEGSHLLGKVPQIEIPKLVAKSQITCACESGDVLVMSPLILHSSRRAKLPARRRILHFEYAPLDCLDRRLSWYEFDGSRSQPDFCATAS